MSDRYLTFNQNKTCFLMTDNNGDKGKFTIYDINPLKERFNRKFNGTISIVEPYYKSNFFAIVGGGEKPWNPPTQVIIWDDYQNKIIAAIDHSTIVKNVKIHKNIICIVLEKSIKIFDFSTLKKKCTIETAPNPHGLIAINEKTLVFPGNNKGTVNIYKINDNENNTSSTGCSFDDGNSIPTIAFENLKTHTNHLTNISISPDNSKLATVSEKGTIIRIHSLKNGNLIKELRRGSDQADIYDIQFDNNPSSNYDLLSVLSDKNTLHIYSISEKGGIKNTKSKLSAFTSILPEYFNSEWSLIQIQTRPFKSIYFFNSPNITIVSADGYVTTYQINIEDRSVKELDQVSLNKPATIN